MTRLLYGGFLRFARAGRSRAGDETIEMETGPQDSRAQAARRRAAQSRARAGSGQGRVQRRRRRRRAWRRWRAQAGVGIGTLYRHFPTREALFEAVYRREVEQLGELAEQLKGEAAPVEALRRWLRSNVEFVATKKGMVAALALAAHATSELTAYSFERLTKAIGAPARPRGRGRRDPRRHQRRGPAARAGRHVLHARPAGLAGERGAACSTCSSTGCA